MVSKAFVDESGIKSTEKVTARPKSSSTPSAKSNQNAVVNSDVAAPPPKTQNAQLVDLTATNLQGSGSADNSKKIVQSSITKNDTSCNVQQQHVNGGGGIAADNAINSQLQQNLKKAQLDNQTKSLKELYHTKKSHVYYQNTTQVPSQTAQHHPQQQPQPQPQPQPQANPVYNSYYNPAVQYSTTNGEAPGAATNMQYQHYNYNPPPQAHAVNYTQSLAPYAQAQQSVVYPNAPQTQIHHYNNAIPIASIAPPVPATIATTTTTANANPTIVNKQTISKTSTNTTSKKNENIQTQPKSNQRTQSRTRRMASQKILPSDVVHGKSIARHPGNEYYRLVLKKYYKDFIASCDKPSERDRIAQAVFRDIINRKPIGGRFMRFSSSRQVWDQMKEKDAYEYIKHVLKDCENRDHGTKKSPREEEVIQARNQRRRLAAAARANAVNETEPIPIEIEDIDDDDDENDIIEVSNNVSSTGPIPEMNLETKVPKGTKADVDAKYYPKTTNSALKANECIQCEKCHGIGFVSLTSSNMISSDSSPSSNGVSMTEAESPEVSSLSEKDGKNQQDSHMTAWEAHIRITEEQLGISKNENLSYPERIKEIEQRSKEKKTNFKRLPLDITEDEQMIEILEQAEKKWGIKVPEGYNFAQRVELIEKTAFTLMARLQVWL